MQTMIHTALSALIISSAAFSAQSGAQNTCRSESTAVKARPLIELFTSEGCSSCPPADRWLSGQRARIEGGDFSAIAWHVDYWDHLGWKDPFGFAAAAPRQRWLANKAGAQVYTPGVFLDGLEWRKWATGALPDRSHHAIPNLALNAERRDGRLQVRTEISALAEKSNLVLVTQLLSRDSQVTRGENSGRLLRHDFSANEMQLTELAANNAAQITTADLALPKGSSAITAFIQNDKGAVLQSTQIFLDRCAPE